MFWYSLVFVTEKKQNYITCCATGILQCVPSFLIQYFCISSSACAHCLLLICKTFLISWATEGLRDKEHASLFIIYHCHSVLRADNYSEIVTWSLLTLLELISMEATKRAEYKLSKKLSAIKVWEEHMYLFLALALENISSRSCLSVWWQVWTSELERLHQETQGYDFSNWNLCVLQCLSFQTSFKFLLEV